MELTLLLLCGVALLAGKCQSGVVIQPCPGGQRNVSEYSNFSLSCGQCSDSIDWYIGCSDAQPTRYQYIGGCKTTECSFQADSSFRLKVTTTETGKLDGVLDMVRVTRNNACRVLCKCYRYYFYYNSSADNGLYLEGNDSCQIFVEEEKQQSTGSSNNWWRWAVIGGAGAFAVIVIIIGIVIAVYRFKRLKETQVKGKTNLSFQLCPENLFDQQNSLSQPYAVANNFKSEPTINREAAFSGNLYSVPIAVTPTYANDDCIPLPKKVENTMFKRDKASKVVSNPTSRQALQPTENPKQTSAKRMEFNNIPATGYMNVTQETNSSSGGYCAPWGGMPALTKPFTRGSYAEALSKDDDDSYIQLNDNYLQFNDKYPRQKGRTPACYSNECFI